MGPNVRGWILVPSPSLASDPSLALLASFRIWLTLRLTSASAAFTSLCRSRMRSTCHASVSEPLPTVADSITPTSCCAASEMPGNKARPSSGAAPSAGAYPPVEASSMTLNRSPTRRRVGTTQAPSASRSGHQISASGLIALRSRRLKVPACAVISDTRKFE